jgi:hypothetical protein
MNLTPLDQAYQVHHGNPVMYTTNKVQMINPKCIFCGDPNSNALMLKQDGGAFRQCGNQLCRKQFYSTGHNWQFTNNTTYKIQEQEQKPKPQIQQNQIQTQQIKEILNNPYLPAEPNFITRFNTNSRQF